MNEFRPHERSASSPSRRAVAPRAPRSAAARALAVALALAAALVLATITGCTLREPETPLLEEPPAATPETPPPAITPTAPPLPEAPETVTAALGEEAEAGSWRISVREARFSERAGDLRATEPGSVLLRVDITLANVTDADLRVSPIDFSITDGAASTFPLTSAEAGLNPAGEIEAGKVGYLRAVFGIPEEKAAGPLTLVFEPSEGGPARVEIELQ